MKTRHSFLLLVAVVLAGCGGKEPKPMPNVNVNNVLKVSVLQSGTVLANESEITLADLDAKLAELKSGNGGVLYYRENGQGEPPPVAMQVIQLIVKHKLPISMSSRPDFSDVIDEHGVSHPRQ